MARWARTISSAPHESDGPNARLRGELAPGITWSTYCAKPLKMRYSELEGGRSAESE